MAQCPDNKKILDELYSNGGLGIDRQKEMLDEVIDCCESRLPRKTAEEKDRCAYAYHKLGNLFLKIGELKRGRAMLEEAEKMYDDPIRKKRAATDLGHYHSNQGNWREAAEMNRKIISSGPLIQQLPAALNLIAALLELGEINDAEYWWNQVWAFRDSLGRYRYYFYHLKGLIEQAKGNIASASDNFQQAKKLAGTDYGENSPEVAKVCLSLGKDHFLPQEKYKEALEAFQEALTAYIPSFRPRNVFAHPSSGDLGFIDDDIMIILELKAKAFLQQYRAGKAGIEVLDTALKCFDLIVQSETSIRTFYETDLADFMMIAQRHKTMELAIEISFELYRKTNKNKYIDEALHFSELVKDILLKESIKEVEGSTSGLIPGDLAAERDRLKAEFRSLATEDGSKTPRHILDAKEKALQEAWGNYLRKLQVGHRSYFNFKYDYVDCSISRIQNKLLSSDQALIEYFIGEQKSYAIAVTRSKAAFVEIPIIAADSSYVYDFISHIIGKHGKSRRRDLYEIKAVQLYNDLIRPIKEKLGLPERLLIIPDGNLANLPFDALIEQEHNGHQKSFFIEQHISSLAYSAGIMLGREKAVRQNELDYLGIAPVIFSEEEDKMPLSLEEVETAREILGGNVLLFEQATKQNFYDTADKYQIVHLATHAAFGDKYPYIMLYGAEELPLPEIYNLKLNANLIILSACEANLGKLLNGEGLMSLTRGFTYAGCFSLMTTQWKVRQETSKELVIAYTGNLRQGMEKDRALAKAKRQFLKMADELYMDPYFWAGLVQFGNTDRLYANSWFSKGLSKERLFYFLTIICLIFLAKKFRQHSAKR